MQLRQSLKEKRRALSIQAREEKSLAIANNLAKHLPFRRALRVALYMATAEEVDTVPLIELAMAYDKEIYLPVINTSRWRSGFMLFHRYKPGESRMIKNKFGIEEPEHRIGTCITGDSLDLVCVPLVGFNDHCDRIGMGGGYYDRTFSGRTFRRRQLVGLAFECQRAEFEPAPHDVPMDAIVTEKSVVLREKASAF